MHGLAELGSRVGATAVATGELEPPEIALCGIEGMEGWRDGGMEGGARSGRAMIVAGSRPWERATGGRFAAGGSSSCRVVDEGPGKPHVRSFRWSVRPHGGVPVVCVSMLQARMAGRACTCTCTAALR